MMYTPYPFYACDALPPVEILCSQWCVHRSLARYVNDNQISTPKPSTGAWPLNPIHSGLRGKLLAENVYILVYAPRQQFFLCPDDKSELDVQKEAISFWKFLIMWSKLPIKQSIDVDNNMYVCYLEIRTFKVSGNKGKYVIKGSVLYDSLYTMSPEVSICFLVVVHSL